MSTSPENTFVNGFEKRPSSTKLFQAERKRSQILFKNISTETTSYNENTNDSLVLEQTCNGGKSIVECPCRCTASAGIMENNDLINKEQASSSEVKDISNIYDDYNIEDNEFDGTELRNKTDDIESALFSRLPSQHCNVGKYLLAVHRKITRQDTYFLSYHKTRPSLFGVPLLIPNNEGGTQKDLYCAVWLQVSRLLSPLPATKDQSNHAADW